jgi:hypothetical protein
VNRLLVVTEAGWWSAYPGGRWDPIPAPPGKASAVEIAPQVDGAVVAATATGLYVAAAEHLQGTRGAAMPFDGEAEPIWRVIDEGGPMQALALSGDHFLALGEHGVTSGQVSAALRGGSVMTTSSTGLDAAPLAAALDPLDPSVAYAMTTDKIYRTDDTGRTWTKLPLPWPAAQLKALAIDPARPDQVLALDYRGAIYRGHDRGEHWLMFDDDPGLFRAWSLRVSPEVPGLALVATLGHGLRVVNLDPLAEAATGGEE